VRYPSTTNLPFNHEAVKEHFIPITPGSQVPEGDGFWLILQGNSLVVCKTGKELWIPCGAAPRFLAGICMPFCIGTWRGVPLQVAAISRTIEIPEPFVAEPFNASGDLLDDATLTLGGMAMQILHWQKRGRFCSCCGGDLTPMVGSWGRHCSSCRSEHFPVIHPCAIVLVRRDDQFLLVRKREWAPGRFGLVAGFLDMGESLEECAAREVLEETGIKVKDVRYVGSQCWPFPSQLMAGFVAEYESGEITVATNELEDARWFSRDIPPEALPPHRSIARWIIERYMLGSEKVA
jgi:NAD+ diphosphatase